jgi:hypothetical protein
MKIPFCPQGTGDFFWQVAINAANASGPGMSVIARVG